MKTVEATERTVRVRTLLCDLTDAELDAAIRGIDYIGPATSSKRRGVLHRLVWWLQGYALAGSK